MIKENAGTRKRKLNNQGATMVTTMVAMLFLIVLGTIIMAVSAMNYRLKSSDRQAKLDFYENEQALDDIYNGIGQESASCLGQAYTTVLNRVTSGIYLTEADAYNAFCTDFTTLLTGVYVPADLTAVTAKLNVYALKSAQVTVLDMDAVTIEYVTGTTVPNRFVFEGVSVQFISPEASNYESIITTDIVVNMPYITFFDENDEVFDYSIVANDGIYFLNADRTVEGNVYAGTASSSSYSVYTGEKDVYGGINFYQSTVDFTSRYLVTKGDMNVRQSAVTLSNGGLEGANLWAESLNTTGGNGASEWANINITGRTFIENDLEINSYDSSITLTGAYYGYNNGVYTTQEYANAGGHAHSMSSAVIINQRLAKLNFSNLNTLIIAGKAYMDFGSEEQSSGESIALKSNQIMYMVPDEFMSFSNPTTDTELSALGLSKDTALNTIVIPNTWFAFTYLRDTARVQYKAYTVDGTIYYYYYLNFIDGAAEDYAREILTATEPADLTDEVAVWKWSLKQKLQKRLFSTVLGNAFIDNISIDSTSPGTVIYGKGAVIKVDPVDTVRNISLVNNSTTVDQVTTLSGALIKRYEWLYYYLNSKEEFALGSGLLSAASTEGYAVDLLPLDSVANITDLNNKISPYTEYLYHCGYRAIVSKENVTIDSDFTGVILCAGDVTVKEGCNVEGLILAAGKVYIRGNGAIISNRSVVQTILNEEIKTEQAKDSTESYNKEFVTYYLRHYNATHDGTTMNQVSTGTDYTNYIVYENWVKGGDN